MNTQYNSSYIFSITLVATLGGLLFGYDTAVISGTVESLNTVFVAPQNLSESAANSLLGFCVASALIGCIIGGALGGYCSNRFGRRDSLKIAAVLFFISGVGSAWPEPRQPGGCKLKTAPVRPVVAARPAEYVCSEDLFY